MSRIGDIENAELKEAYEVWNEAYQHAIRLGAADLLDDLRPRSLVALNYLAVQGMGHVHEVRKVLSKLIAWARREAAEPETSPDGPHVDGLMWKGKCYRLPPKPRRLLRAMWNCESRPLDEVIVEVWGHDEETTTNAVSQAVKKANKALAEAGVPWSLSKTQDRIARS